MKYWIGTVSHNHVQRGLKLGIAQIGHGKLSGLARMHTGDWLIYYSPRESLDNAIPVQTFTAIGQIADETIWQADEAISNRTAARSITHAQSSPPSVPFLNN